MMDHLKGLLCCALVLICFNFVTVCGDEEELRFLSRAQNLLPKEGENVTLTCQLNHSPTAKGIIWSKGSDTISFNQFAQLDRYSVSADSASPTRVTLLITNVMQEDSGDYQCAVGELKQTSHVTVQVPAKAKIIPDRDNVTLNVGEKQTLTCNVSGTPTPTITWLKSGRNLGYHEPQFRIGPVGEDDGAEYTCRATNGVGAPGEDTISVDVLFPPRVVTNKQTEVVALGNTVSVECSFYGNPEPRTMVSHNGHDIPNKGSGGDMGHQGGIKVGPQVKSSGTLRRHIFITGISREDLGNFTCFGQNDLGNDSATILVTALPQDLTITSLPASPYSDQYTLTWTVRSEEVLKQYNILFRPLVPMTTPTPTPSLSNLTVTTPSSNSSCSNCSVSYSVVPSSSNTSSSSSNTSSSSGDAAPEESVWETEEVRAEDPWPKDGTHKQTYTFTGLKENSTYIIKLQAENLFGLSDWTEEFQFRTSPVRNPAPAPTREVSSHTDSQDRREGEGQETTTVSISEELAESTSTSDGIFPSKYAIERESVSISQELLPSYRAIVEPTPPAVDAGCPVVLPSLGLLLAMLTLRWV